MVRVISKKNPSLFIVDPRVQFVDGVAEVSPETAKRLRAFAVHGVEVEGAEPPADEPEAPADGEGVEEQVEGAEPPAEDAPKPYASRGDWAAYAESVGVEPGDMTKAQIQSAIANL